MGPVPRSLVGLVTDFGSRDPYAAAVKAVIAARCSATLVDLTHEIAPGDVFEAAWFLRSLARFLPGGGLAGEKETRTICVTVVDPGVGTERRIVAMASRGVVHLAPDNGVLTFVVSEDAGLFSVVNERLYLPSDCTTFHGRDRFAPVAAALADGLAVEMLGPPIDVQSLVRLAYEQPRYAKRSATGQVVSIDRFGNVITDLEAEECRSAGMALGAFEANPGGNVADPPPTSGARLLEIRVQASNGRVGRWSMGVRRTYESMPDSPGPFLIVGSQGTLEISLAGASAADVLQMARFDRIELVAFQ
jgi:S-adenosylmethionine hydrolase